MDVLAKFSIGKLFFLHLGDIYYSTLIEFSGIKKQAPSDPGYWVEANPSSRPRRLRLKLKATRGKIPGFLVGKLETGRKMQKMINFSKKWDVLSVGQNTNKFIETEIHII